MKSAGQQGLQEPATCKKHVDKARPLSERLRDKSAHIAVLGLGYAGLPMAIELGRAGFVVTGLDINDERVRLVNEGRSPVSDVSDADVANLIKTSQLSAVNKFDVLAEADCALICVPTPLAADHSPDLRFVEAAAESIAAHLHPDMLIVLQSTCAPGTTRRVLVPMLEASSKLRAGEDFFVAFAPERIDPGNRQYTVVNTPKLIGGVTPQCSELASLLFTSLVEHLVIVSSPEVAEMSKLVENTFRFINISFVNEMALLCDRMGISIWEVIEAASTKPFAFLPHHPGPGVGGHCIPVVPFYLEAAAHEYGMAARLIEAASSINEKMPQFVVAKLERLLAKRGKRLGEARVLLLGIAYKQNVNDIRESPALRVLELLAKREAHVAYYDPHVPSATCDGMVFRSLTSRELNQEHYDCAVLLTPHSDVDYCLVARHVDLILDTRNYLTRTGGTEVVQL